MANPPPAPGQKKKGLGCLGCGCLIVLILALLGVALVVGGSYLGYRSIYALTSPDAADIPTFDGGDDVYNGALQKTTTFNQNLEQNQPASLQLSADELNTLVARNPSLSIAKVKLFFSITDDQLRAQTSLPLTSVFGALFKDRYLNADTTVSFTFDPDTHTLHLTLHSLKIGEQTLPDDDLPLLQQEFEPVLNAQLQKNAYLKKIIDHAKSIQVQNGVLDVETQ